MELPLSRISCRMHWHISATSRWRVLTGFMLGSLNKVWPWKEVVETFVDSHGEVKPLIETNILPNAHVPEAVVLMVVGFFLVYFLEKLSAKTPVR